MSVVIRLFGILLAHLDVESFERGNQVCDALLQSSPLNTQGLVCSRSVNLEQLRGRGSLATLDLGTGDGAAAVGEVLVHNLGNFLVGKTTADDKEALASSLGLLERSDVGGGNVTHVDPEDHGAGRGDLLLPLALQQRDDALVGGVDGVRGGEVVDDGAIHQRGVHSRQLKVGLLLVHKLPGGALGEGLGDAVADQLVLLDVLDGVGVPGLFAEDGAVVVDLAAVDDGSEGAGDDDAAHVGRVLLDAAQDPRSAVDGRGDELRLGVGEVVVEGRRRVQDDGEAGAVLREDGVKGRGDGNVADGDDGQALRGDQVWVRGVDEVGLGLVTHRRDDSVASAQQLLEDVGGDEAGATCRRGTRDVSAG